MKVRPQQVTTDGGRSEHTLLESIAETLEILADAELMAALRASIREIERGETYSSDDIKAKLGL